MPYSNRYYTDTIIVTMKLILFLSTLISQNNYRAENINETFDFIVSRAVTNMTDFKKWVKGKFNKSHNNTLNNGILYLKGGDLTEELKGISHQQYNIANFFEEDFFETKKVVYISY